MEIEEINKGPFVDPRKLKRRKGRARLSEISVDEISLVTTPAIGRTWLIFKNLEDESLDLSDPETIERLETELASLTPEEEAEIMETLKGLDASLTLQLMEVDYEKLKKSDYGLAKLLKTNPEMIDWSLSSGFTMKPEYKFSKTKYLSANKKYEFDPDALKWFPVKKEVR